MEWFYLYSEMRKFLLLLLLCLPSILLSQVNSEWKKEALVITPELLFGNTTESNDFFPETKLQKQFMIGLARDQSKNQQEWAYRLKGPKTGVSLGYTDFGNLDSLGVAITAMPYIEFNLFRQKRVTALVAMGASYFTEKYDPITNPNNRAVTTDLTWAYRTYFYFNVLRGKRIDYKLGVGYSHHSNGHTKLDNQGYNSFLVSLKGDIKNPFRHDPPATDLAIIEYHKSSYSYFIARTGFGKNVFAEAFNTNKNILSISGEYGKVINNTFKIGVGFYYRFYEHYYDYIKQNESLVQDGREFEHLRDHPFFSASNIGLTLNAEFLLNHVGLDIQLGYNLHKPAYKIDWRLNEGWEDTPREVPVTWMLGEYTPKYKLKQQISSRLGLKYYLIGTSKAPKHNVFIGAHLNSNLGQADFTELSIGYIHSFNHKGGN